MTADNQNISKIDWLFSRKIDLFLLVVLCTLGLALRSTGLFHAIGTHPDERHIVQVTSTLEANNMNPKSFAYGSFSFYAAWGFAKLVAAFNVSIPKLTNEGNWIWINPSTYDGYFITGRAFCLLMGSACIGLVYYLSVLLYRSSFVGLIAGFFVATNVFHLQLSRYFTSDITLTTIALISLIALVRAYQRNGLRDYLLFGFCAGLATATKISSVFLFVPLGIVIGIAALRDWYPERSWERPLKTIGVIVGGLALLLLAQQLTFWKGYPKVLGYRISEVAFLIPASIPIFTGIALSLGRISRPTSFLFASLALGSIVFTLAEPYAILDFHTFQRHTSEQTRMVRGYWRPPYTIQYEHTMPYLYHLKQMMFYTMGIPLFLLCGAGLVRALISTIFEVLERTLRHQFLTKPLRTEMIPLVFLLVFFGATGYFQVKFPRYLLPLYPLLFIFGASMFRNMSFRKNDSAFSK